MVEEMRVVLQLGFQKNKKRTQSVDFYINEEKVQRDKDKGIYLTTNKDYRLKGESWFLYETDLSQDDMITLHVKTFLTGIGPDEDLSFETIYSVDESTATKEVTVNGVGRKDYPLIKGKIVEVANVSEDDKRKQDISEFLNRGFDDESDA
jgi:hypothetical protein